jgi:dihydropteroate synthase
MPPMSDNPPAFSTPNTKIETWSLGQGQAILLDRPRVMGVLNLTPDSFYSGSRIEVARVVQAAGEAQEAGADIVDLGAESTRPGSRPVDERAQLERLVPAVRGIRGASGPLASLPISVDTTRAGVARACLEAGADAINDVSGGCEDPAMFGVVARAGAGLILMHRVRPPAEDQYSDQYQTPPMTGDVVQIVGDWLAGRVREAVAAGVRPNAIVVDPGLGFGKTVEQNMELIWQTPTVQALAGRPLVSALSRKSFVGRVSLDRDSDPSERLPGTLALSVTHLHRRASIYRVHDVGPHVQALRAAWKAHRTDG